MGVVVLCRAICLTESSILRGLVIDCSAILLISTFKHSVLGNVQNNPSKSHKLGIIEFTGFRSDTSRGNPKIPSHNCLHATDCTCDSEINGVSRGFEETGIQPGPGTQRGNVVVASHQSLLVWAVGNGSPG